MATVMPNALPPDDNRGPAINIICWTGFTICTIVVAARLFTRLRISRSAGWDDGIIVLSMVSFFRDGLVLRS